MAQKSFLFVLDTDFGIGFGKSQHAISDELLKYRAKALSIRARKLPQDDQRHMTFLNREDCPFASQLLSGCPLPVALGPFHADFAPTDYSAHLWSAPDSSTRIVRWI